MMSQLLHYKQIILIMRNERNLYSSTSFSLPQLNHEPLTNPFRQHKLLKFQGLELPDPPHPKTLSIKYSQIFETIVGRENLYPMFLDCNEQSLVICGKDCFVVCGVQSLLERKIFKEQKEGKDYNEWIKVNFPEHEIPTAVKVGKRFIYFGYQSGKILQYDLAKLSFGGSCEEFAAPIMQLQILREEESDNYETEVIAMDSAANLKLVNFNHKTFMNRVIKVMTDAKDIKITQEVKKRQKIKKMFRNILSGKQQQSQDVYPYHHVYFATPPKDFQRQQQITIAYFYPTTEEKKPQNQQAPVAKQQQSETMNKSVKQKNKQNLKDKSKNYRYSLAIVTFDTQKSQILSEHVLVADLEQVGMINFGYGGFQCGNSTYILLAVSVGPQIHYFRAVDVQGVYEWHLVSQFQITVQPLSENQLPLSMLTEEQQIHPSLIYGQFLSNNLLLYLTKCQILISNVNEPLQLISPLDLSKFSYIEFFNSESEFKFKFDAKLIHRNILRGWSDQNQTGYFCVLEGKRLMIGNVRSWKEYLTSFVDAGEWVLGMKFALMVYQGKLKKLTAINEKIEKRKADMQSYFEQITLAYLAYAIRKRFSQLSKNDQDQNSTQPDTKQTETLAKQHQGNYKKVEQQSRDQEEDKKSVSPTTQEKVEQRQQQSAEKGQTDDGFDKVILETIDLAMKFMIETQSTHYLFTTIFESICNLKLENYFFHLLWKQVEAGVLSFMTEQILNKTIVHYKEKGQLDKLNMLIMGFDLKIMEKQLLLSLCLSEGLYEALIQICVSDKDYITPVIKLSGLRLQKYRQKSAEANHLNTVIFYFLEQCLQGRKTQYGNDADFLSMLQQILSFMFIPSSLDMLGQIQPTRVMEIIDILFQPKVLRVILQNEGLKIRKRVDFQKIFEQNAIAQYAVYENILTTLMHTFMRMGKSEKQISERDYNIMISSQQHRCHCHTIYEFVLWKFLTFTILKNQLPFKVAIKISCTKFYIGHPYIFEHPAEKETEVNAYLMRLMDSTLRSLDDQVIQTVKQDELEIEQQPIDSQKILTQFLKDIQLSDYRGYMAESMCYLYHELGQTDKVLITYLQMKNKDIRQKVFSYLKHNLRIQPKNVHIPLGKEVLQNVQSLICLNDKDTIELLLRVVKFGIAESQDIVVKLAGNPQLQLQFIEKILNPSMESPRGKSPSSKQLHSLAVCHLQIVVQNKPEQLQEYIQKINYPLEEAFKVCQERKNKSGMAYILIKSGRNIEGVVMLTQILLDQCDQVFKMIAKKEVKQCETQRERLETLLTKVLDNCSNEHKSDPVRGEQIWSLMADKVFRHLRIQNMQSQKIPAPIKEILNLVVNSIMEQMFLRVSPDFFVTKFVNFNSSEKQKGPGGLPTSVLLQGFKMLWTRLSFQDRLQSLCLEGAQKADARLFTAILRQRTNGWACGKFCGGPQQQNQFGCHKEIIDSNYKGKGSFVTYQNCRHIYHTECNNYEICRHCHNETGNKIQKQIQYRQRKLEEREGNKRQLNQGVVERLKLENRDLRHSASVIVNKFKQFQEQYENKWNYLNEWQLMPKKPQ